MVKIASFTALAFALITSHVSAGTPHSLSFTNKYGFPQTVTFSGTTEAGGGTAIVEVGGTCQGKCSGTVTWKAHGKKVCVNYAEVWPESRTICY